MFLSWIPKYLKVVLGDASGAFSQSPTVSLKLYPAESSFSGLFVHCMGVGGTVHQQYTQKHVPVYIIHLIYKKKKKMLETKKGYLFGTEPGDDQ